MIQAIDGRTTLCNFLYSTLQLWLIITSLHHTLFITHCIVDDNAKGGDPCMPCWRVGALLGRMDAS
jgi:hypothetical protein